VENKAQGIRPPRNSKLNKGASVQFHLRLVDNPTGNAVRIWYRDYGTGLDDFTPINRRSIENDIPYNLSESSTSSREK
jgi:hypothetical protein